MRQTLRTVSILLIFAIFIGTANAFAQTAAPAQPAAGANAANGSGPATPEDPALKAELDKALDFFRKNDFPKALEVLKALYEERPNIIPPRMVFAQWFRMANIGDAERASWEMATAETPSDPEAFIRLGMAALQQRELTAAEALFEKAEERLGAYTVNAERKKNLGIALYNSQAALYEARGRWVPMHNAIVKLMNTTTPTAVMYRQLAVAAFQQGYDPANAAKKAEFEARAKEFLHNATLCEDGKTGLPVDGIMCRLYLSKGEKEKAEASLAAALKNHANSPEVLTLASMLRLNNNDIAGAFTYAQQLIKAEPNSNDAKRIMGTVALYQADYSQAEKWFQEIVTASPLDAAAINGLALALVESSDATKQQRGLEYAVNNAKTDQRNVEFLGTLGWAFIKMNRSQDAVRVLQQSAASGQINSATAYYLAELSARNNNFVQAKSLLEAALKSPQPFFKRVAAQTLLETVKAAEQAATQPNAAAPK